MNLMQQFCKSSRPMVIGMVHSKPLPGTPLYNNSIEELLSKAKTDAHIYKETGVDAVMIENMWDIPYIQRKEIGPEIVSCMTMMCHKVREILPRNIPCGVQILAGGEEHALSVSLAADLQFIRAESFVFGHVADEGWMDACGGSLLRYRKLIGAENIAIFTDIKKKHSAHTLTDDVSIVETAKAAEFFLSNGVIITGSATGMAANAHDLKEIKEHVSIPVLVGSGVTIANVEDYMDADGFIIGSHFKHNDRWTGDLEPQKIEAFMKKITE